MGLWKKNGDIRKQIFIAMGKGREVRVEIPDALYRVALHDHPGAPKLGMFRDLLVVQLIDLALRCNIIDLQAGGGRDVRFSRSAERIVQSGSLDIGDLGKWDVTIFLPDVADVFKRRQEWLRILLRASVRERPENNGLLQIRWHWPCGWGNLVRATTYLSLAYGCVHSV